jgi:Xaa-Pro aminopeptidase
VNAASTKYMTHDIPYEFRQNSNFMYLTGLEEPDAVAVFLKTQQKTSFILFVLPRDAHRLVRPFVSSRAILNSSLLYRMAL